jgi:hypothetical protein
LVDWQALFTPLGGELQMVLLETFLFVACCIPMGCYFVVHGHALSFGNTVWVMFLEEYPWRTQVA